MGSFAEQVMPELESVRLVIWDLDGVFWLGNYTEGGITYRPECNDIVIELARRGIMSSVCSKNELAVVKRILEEHGIWDYFIFPSINWDHKGQRIAEMIKAVQLRSESVMFIDDNPMNLAEAKHYVPNIQTADEKFIQLMLADKRFKGKEFDEFSRLKQYKILENRHTQALVLSDDNRTFLCNSNITVEIEHDVEANLDRAIELINRTNQLNFIKDRLPEQDNAAREDLRNSIRQFNAYSGLIKVVDRYGDYGFAGFFLLNGSYHQSTLKYFCFSCRIMGMGVETWLYHHLGRPFIKLAPDISANVFTDDFIVDWITFGPISETPKLKSSDKLINRLVLRGGCDLSSISFYLSRIAETYYIETNTFRENRELRTDSATLLRHAFDEVSPDVENALLDVGFVKEDWHSALSLRKTPGLRTVWIFSFWLDAILNFYRHRALDVVVPFFLERNSHFWCDVTKLDFSCVEEFLNSSINRRAYEALKSDFVGIGNMSQEILNKALEPLISSLDETTLVFIMLLPEKRTDPQTGDWICRPAETRFNEWLREALNNKTQVHLVDILEFADQRAILPEDFHFDRLVYKRTAEHIISVIDDRFGKRN